MSTNAVYEPMLARVYEDVPVTYPCYVQPKLDGIRCIATYFPEGNTVVAQSRGGKPLTLPDHLKDLLLQFFTSDHNADMVLDGELYIHGLSFQEVMSRVKRVKHGIHPEAHLVGYHIYDQITDEPFSIRHAKLIDALLHSDMPLKAGVFTVHTEVCNTKAETDFLHKAFVSQKYEGSMIRSGNVPYEIGKRSKSLLKRKDWKEDDFEIISIEEGKGKNQGTAVLTMKTTTGQTFSATAPGNYVEKASMWQKRDSFLGKKCSVKFQEYTDGGVPRFPEALGVKEDR